MPFSFILMWCRASGSASDKGESPSPCASAGELGGTVLDGPSPPAFSAAVRRHGLLSAVLVLLVLSPSWATAATATLTVAEIVAPPAGNSLSLPILLSAPAGQRVAAIQFDVAFDAAVLELPAIAGIVPSATLKAIGKQINYSPIAPGRVRVLVVGFNQEAIPNGEVAALQFSIHRERMRAPEPVTVVNVLLSDPGGTRIPVEGRNGSVRLTAAPMEAAAVSHRSHSMLVSLVVSLTVVIGVLMACAMSGLMWGRHGRVRPRHRSRT